MSKDLSQWTMITEVVMYVSRFIDLQNILDLLNLILFYFRTQFCTKFLATLIQKYLIKNISKCSLFINKQREYKKKYKSLKMKVLYSPAHYHTFIWKTLLDFPSKNSLLWDRNIKYLHNGFSVTEVLCCFTFYVWTYFVNSHLEIFWTSIFGSNILFIHEGGNPWIYFLTNMNYLIDKLFF